jgi:hypothetical protein
VVRIEDGIVVDCTIDGINTMLFWGNFSQNGMTKDEIAKFGDDNIHTAMFDFHEAKTPTKFAKHAEITVVGNEGVVGVALFMGGETMPNRAVVQSAGQGYRPTCWACGAKA